MRYIVFKTRFVAGRDYQDIHPHLFPTLLRRNGMHVSGNGWINAGSGVRGSCTPFTKYALCPTIQQRCGTSDEGQPGMAAGSGVANPRRREQGGGTRASFILTSFGRPGSDDDVSEFCPEDYFSEVVGNHVRERSSSTANQRDRSNSADPAHAELAMRMRLTLAEDKAILFHCSAEGFRSPLDSAMLPPIAAPGSSLEQVDNQMQRSLGEVVQIGDSSNSSGRRQDGNQI